MSVQRTVTAAAACRVYEHLKGLAGKDGNCALPPIMGIAIATGLAERTVARVLKRLEESGLIRRWWVQVMDAPESGIDWEAVRRIRSREGRQG